MTITSASWPSVAGSFGPRRIGSGCWSKSARLRASANSTSCRRRKLRRAKPFGNAGYRVEKLLLRPEEGIMLSACLFVPEKSPSGKVVLYVHEQGCEADAAPGGPIEQLVRGGARVLAVEVRGTGHSQHTKLKSFGPQIGTDWQDVTTAYLLGRSYVGMRAEDLLVAARYAMTSLDGGPRRRRGSGCRGPRRRARPARRRAGAGAVPLRETLSNTRLLGQRHRVPGDVRAASQCGSRRFTQYDLPDLAETLGAKLTVEEPLNAKGKPIAMTR